MVKLSKKLSATVSKEIKENGFISMDKGETWLVALPVDDEHFDLTDKFREQLKQEGRYGKKTAFMTNPIKSGEKVKMLWLPIYGSATEYVTRTIISDTVDSALEVFYETAPAAIKKRFDIS